MFIRFPPRRILVPLDFSPPSKAALEAAESLGGLFGSRLELVSVLEPLPSMAPELRLLPLAEAREGLPDLRRRLREAAAGYKGELRSRAFAGPPPATLAGLAVPRQADLAVLGTHGYRGLERAVYGSTAEAVVTRARIPVMTVRKLPHAFRLRSILCPVNMTPYSTVALSYAALFAQAAGASLSALYVRPEAVWQEDARMLLAQFLQETLGASAAAVTGLVARGEPREEIARRARAGGFDLAVLSAHRRPWTSDALLGGTAQRVMRGSNVPVLSVPAPAPRRSGRPEPLVLQGTP